MEFTIVFDEIDIRFIKDLVLNEKESAYCGDTNIDREDLWNEWDPDMFDMDEVDLAHLQDIANGLDAAKEVNVQIFLPEEEKDDAD